MNRLPTQKVVMNTEGLDIQSRGLDPGVEFQALDWAKGPNVHSGDGLGF